jgi:four helix bundle protein
MNKGELQQRTYTFSLEIIRFCQALPEKRIYWSISDQLLRTATSIGANIVEAQAASSKRDFIKFFQIALKSANETCYWLKLLKDSEILSSQKTIEPLLGELDEICRMLGRSILTMKRKTC